MNYGPGFDGFGGFPHLIGLAFYGIFVLLMIGVFLTLAFLLARFLLVGTRAAKIYVEKNSSTVAAPAATTPPAPSSAPATATTPAAAEPTVTKTTSTRATTKPITPVTPAPKPATKPRTPKTPPVE